MLLLFTDAPTYIDIDPIDVGFINRRLNRLFDKCCFITTFTIQHDPSPIAYSREIKLDLYPVYVNGDNYGSYFIHDKEAIIDCLYKLYIRYDCPKRIRKVIPRYYDKIRKYYEQYPEININEALIEFL